MTLLAKDEHLRVARPRSPIFTEPVGPVMKMLSHFRSLWMIGGVLVWRKWRPFRICRHQLLRTLIFITLNRFRYLYTQREGITTMAVAWIVVKGCIYVVDIDFDCTESVKSGSLEFSSRENAFDNSFFLLLWAGLAGHSTSPEPFFTITKKKQKNIWKKSAVCVDGSLLVKLVVS